MFLPWIMEILGEFLDWFINKCCCKQSVNLNDTKTKQVFIDNFPLVRPWTNFKTMRRMHQLRNFQTRLDLDEIQSLERYLREGEFLECYFEAGPQFVYQLHLIWFHIGKINSRIQLLGMVSSLRTLIWMSLTFVYTERKNPVANPTLMQKLMIVTSTSILVASRLFSHVITLPNSRWTLYDNQGKLDTFAGVLALIGSTLIALTMLSFCYRISASEAKVNIKKGLLMGTIFLLFPCIWLDDPWAMFCLAVCNSIQCLLFGILSLISLDQVYITKPIGNHGNPTALPNYTISAMEPLFEITPGQRLGYGIAILVVLPFVLTAIPLSIKCWSSPRMATRLRRLFRSQKVANESDKMLLGLVDHNPAQAYAYIKDDVKYDTGTEEGQKYFQILKDCKTHARKCSEAKYFKEERKCCSCCKCYCTFCCCGCIECKTRRPEPCSMEEEHQDFVDKVHQALMIRSALTGQIGLYDKVKEKIPNCDIQP